MTTGLTYSTYVDQISTMAVVAANDVAFQAICDMRLDFLKRLPTFETFGKGWTIRVAEVKDKASGMA